MDDVFKGLVTNLGVFAPCAMLGWWIIRNQAKQLEVERARNAVLTDRVIDLAQSGEKTLAELTSAVRANH